MLFWALFVVYYSIGFFVCLHIADVEGEPPKLWHVPLIALVWPLFFIADWTDE